MPVHYRAPYTYAHTEGQLSVNNLPQKVGGDTGMFLFIFLIRLHNLVLAAQS